MTVTVLIYDRACIVPYSLAITPPLLKRNFREKRGGGGARTSERESVLSLSLPGLCAR